jgi:hypothetical protein
MRLEILETIRKPNYFNAEICSCLIPGQVRVIYFYLGALMWTERVRKDVAKARFEGVYREYLRGNFVLESRVA